MTFPAGAHVSPWVDTMPPPSLGDTAFREVDVDVAVLGSGIAGATTALLLKRAGLRVALLEARDIAHSVTTQSTVKVTIGQGTVYSQIESKLGVEAAQTYAQANAAGFEQIVNLIGDLGIDCDLERVAHFVYATDDTQAASVRAEAELAARLGLPASETDQVPLPFPVTTGLRFDDQAQFHPGKYLAALVSAVPGDGCHVFEHVRALDVSEDERCRVQTTAGELTADRVVVATHYPVLNRGGQFTKLTPMRSYGIAGVLPPQHTAGMTINAGSPTRSTRTAPYGDDTLLIVVGEGHQVGHATDTDERWTRLEQWAQRNFAVSDFRYRWSTQDNQTLDHVPYVGRLTPGSDRLFTATGFGGWGMTNGSAAALILSDLILGRDNPWARLFDASRVDPLATGRQLVGQNLRVAQTLLKDRVGSSPAGSPAEVGPGESAVLEVEGEETAIYRDEQGTVHAVSAVCTHMGCTVRWNAGERSWDCPCHGSRFGVDGEVLHSPAVAPLRQIRLGDDG